MMYGGTPLDLEYYVFFYFQQYIRRSAVGVLHNAH